MTVLSPSKVRFSSILILFLVVCCEGKILFHSDFERGETHVAKALKPGAKVIELVPNSKLGQWPLGGGEGIVEGNLSLASETFRYERRDGNRLKGVTGIGKPHAKWSNIRTGNLGEWHEHEANREDACAPPALERNEVLFEQYSVRFDGLQAKQCYLIKTFETDMPVEIHYRFYFRLASKGLLRTGTKKVAIAHTVTSKGTTPRISILRETRGGGFVFGLSRDETDSWSIVKRHLMSREDAAVEPERMYGVECGIISTDPDLLRMRLKVNGSLVEELLLKPKPMADGPSTMVIGKLTKGSIGADLFVDEVVLSGAPIGLLPGRPALAVGASGIAANLLPGEARLSASQWQVSYSNAWLMPVFNSGERKPELNRLDFPLTTLLATPIGEGGTEGFHPIRIPAMLQPGNSCFVRMRGCNNSGNWGEWSEPVAFRPSENSSEDEAFTPGLPKIDAIRFSPVGRRSELRQAAKGAWYDVHAEFSGNDKDEFSAHSFVDLYFSSEPENAISNYANRGGVFSPSDNYVVSLNLGRNEVYAKQIIGKDEFSRLDGKPGLYCDGRAEAYQYIPEKGHARFRFRFPREALEGPWQISGFVRNRKALVSPMFRRLIFVSNSSLKHHPGIGLLVAGVAVGLLAAGAAIVFWRRSSAAPVDRTSSDDNAVPLEIGPEHRERIEAARNYILENFTKPISSDDVATAIGLSTNWLGTVFKSGTGKGVSQYINELRIAKARELLGQTNTSVTEIAFQVGFRSFHSFRGAFRRSEGISAAAFRDKAQKSG